MAPRTAIVALVVLLAACSGSPPRPSPTDQRDDAAAGAVYVVRRSWHVDIGFAAADLDTLLTQVSASFPGAQYVLFGFGDRHYLLHRNGSTLLSALWPGPGVVLATAISRPLEQTFDADDVVQIPVSHAGMVALQAYVARTLTVRNGAVLEAIADGPYAGSRYYESPGRYSAVYTCNTWAADALRSAGLPVRATGVAFAGSLWRQVKPLRQSSAVGAVPTADVAR